MILPIQNAILLSTNKIQIDFLRVDMVHPIISGNKWFKLKYIFEDKKCSDAKTIVSFGGYWSNHLLATAYFAKLNKKKSIGYVHTYQPPILNDCLSEATNYGMDIRFVEKKIFLALINNYTPNTDEYIIPFGGNSELGLKGTAEILQSANTSIYTHIVTAVGTGTTFAGLYVSKLPFQQIIGINVIKNNKNIIENIENILHCSLDKKTGIIFNEYHFGGIGKWVTLQKIMMDQLLITDNIPLDIVYSSKVCLAVNDLVQKNFFPPNSKILIIHNGGLQGNRSLK